LLMNLVANAISTGPIASATRAEPPSLAAGAGCSAGSDQWPVTAKSVVIRVMDVVSGQGARTRAGMPAVEQRREQ
jgi:hypothetical protein